MPSFDRVSSRWDVGKLEIAMLVGNGVVRTLDRHDDRIHPNMTCVAFQISFSIALKRPFDRMVRNREWNVIKLDAGHMDVVQDGIVTHHRQVVAFWN